VRLSRFRFAALPAALVVSACSESAPTRTAAPADPTTDAWYAQTVAELSGMNHNATELIGKGKPDAAADLIVKGEELSKRLMSVRDPTFAATAAASDVDELYGKMLLSNHNYGWARLLFQKNVSRWKYRKPATPDTEARLKQAQQEIEECDRRMAGGRPNP
jgi:hypothetical protein